MKVTLDLDQLLSEEKITQIEYERLGKLAAKSTGSQAFNILIGFGVIAVSGAALALAPEPITAIVIGVCTLSIWGILLMINSENWNVLAHICLLVGTLLTGGGIIASGNGSLTSMISVTLMFSLASIFARNTLLAVLSTLLLSTCIGTGTGYFHASYFLFVEQPIITVILFSMIAIGLHQLSKILPPGYVTIVDAAAGTAIFLVNFGFWVGSLWGDKAWAGKIIVSDVVFAALWALALIATAIWAWTQNRRWLLNTVATFGGIHFYTQWFETLGASPLTVLVAGIIALGFAIGLKIINNLMKENVQQQIQ